MAPVLDAVYETIRKWFPRVSADKLDELCFAIVHDALHVAHVENGIWNIRLDESLQLPHLKSRNGKEYIVQPITIAPVSRRISNLLAACLDDDWDDPDEIAGFIANQLSARPDPDDPRRWWITLPSADGSDPDDDDYP